MIESVQHSNIAEEEMGQLHSIHFSENAINKIRVGMKTGPSLIHCKECGDEIPKARREAVRGCTTCIHCQNDLEKK